MNEPNLRYAKGMPITIAGFGQIGRFLERMDENPKKNSELIGLSNGFFGLKKPLLNKKSRVTSSIFNCCYSVFFWYLLFLEQMTKEVPGIRPAVISAEPGTRLDENYNAETTPVNNLECKAEEKTPHIVLVNATWFSTFS